MNRNLSILPAFFVFFMLLLYNNTYGSLIQYQEEEPLSVPLDVLTTNSEFIFQGKVISHKGYIDKYGMPKTTVVVQVTDWLKGAPHQEKIELTFLGGEKGDYILKVSEISIPSPGEEGIFFVCPGYKGRPHPLCGWDRGRFVVQNDKVFMLDGSPILVQTSQDGRRKVIPSSDKTLPTVSLEEFKKLVKNIMEEQR